MRSSSELAPERHSALISRVFLPTCVAQDGGPTWGWGGRATGVGHAMMRFFPKVSVASTAGSIDRPTSLLGQTDAVRHPVALCGPGSAWMVVLRCGGGKDDG
jgi:hypothetical protein